MKTSKWLTIKALLFGYLYFKVNGKPFMLYHNAKDNRLSIPGNVYFKGFHLWTFRWYGFYTRVVWGDDGQT